MENPERMHMSSPTEGASSLAAGEAQDGGSLSGDEEEEEEDAAPLQPMICLIQEQAKSMVAIQELQRDVDILLEFREQLLSSLGGLYTSGTGTGTPRGLSSPGPGSVSGRISRHHSQPTIGAASAPRRGFSLSPASRVMGVKTPSSHTSAFRRHYTASKDLPSKSRSAENDSETVDTSDEMDGRHPWSRRGVGSGGLVQSGHATAPRYHHTARARTRRRFSANVVPGSPAASGDVFPGSKGNSEPTNAPLVQDSGFSTETKDNSSSGEAHNNARPSSLATATVTTASSDRTQLSSSSSERNLVYSDWMPDIRWPDGKKSQFDADPEDELWNLLDVIHRKGVRLRKEAVEATTPVDKCEPQAPPVSVENIIAELEALRVERDRLQGEVLDLKRENVSSKSQVNSLQDQVLKVHDEKRRLEDQLKTAVSWKTELDNKIHDMHLQFVKSPSHSSKSTASSATNADVRLKKNALTRVQYVQQNLEEKTDGKLDVEDSPVVADGDDAAAVKKLRSRSEDNLPRNPARLPSLPVSLPAGKINVSPNRAKISAVLQEKDILVLKKQLLLYIQAYEVTKARLGGVQREWASRVNEWESISQEWQDELTSLRDQNQDLRFQVEEKNIELEGTKARLRMMERSIRSASSSPSPTNATPSPVTTLTRQSLKRTEKSTNLTQKFPVSENHVIIEEDEGSGVREVKKIERKGSVRFHLGEDDQSRQPRIVDPTTVTVTVGSTDIGHKDDRESSSTESSSGKVPNNFLDGKPAAENAVPPPVNFSSVIPYRPGYSAKQELVQSQSHNFFFARDPPVFNPSLRTYSANNINNNNNNNKATSPPNVVRKSSLSTNVAPSNLENANRWKSSKNSELLAKVISAATPAEFHSHVVDSHHHISAGDHIISNPQKARQRTSFWRSWWKFS